jgi:hypothetical protein
MFNFIDIYIFIPVSGCIGRDPCGLLCPGPIMMLKHMLFICLKHISWILTLLILKGKKVSYHTTSKLTMETKLKLKLEPCKITWDILLYKEILILSGSQQKRKIKEEKGMLYKDIVVSKPFHLHVLSKPVFIRLQKSLWSLCYGTVVVIADRMDLCDNLSSSLQILLNCEHNDPWHWIKVGIDFEYYSPTRLQTRGPKVRFICPNDILYRLLMGL